MLINVFIQIYHSLLPRSRAQMCLPRQDFYWCMGAILTGSLPATSDSYGYLQELNQAGCVQVHCLKHQATAAPLLTC